MRVRILLRLFVAFYISMAAYCVLSVIAGPAGLIAYRELAARRVLMDSNLDALGTTNAALSAELASLQSDPDRTSREARALGYLGSGESEFVIQGDDSSRGLQNYQAGAVVRALSSAPMADGLIKEISFLVGLLVLAAGFAFDLVERPAGRRSRASASRLQHPTI
jgi:cell division protein FtsB